MSASTRFRVITCYPAAAGGRDREYAFFRIAGDGGGALLAAAYALGEARDNLARKAPAALVRLEELVAPVEIALEPAADLAAAERDDGSGTSQPSV